MCAWSYVFRLRTLHNRKKIRCRVKLQPGWECAEQAVSATTTAVFRSSGRRPLYPCAPLLALLQSLEGRGASACSDLHYNVAALSKNATVKFQKSGLFRRGRYVRMSLAIWEDIPLGNDTTIFTSAS